MEIFTSPSGQLRKVKNWHARNAVVT